MRFCGLGRGGDRPGQRQRGCGYEDRRRGGCTGRSGGGQHIQDGQPVLSRRGHKCRVQRIGDNLTVVVLPVHPRARVIDMLPRTTPQPGFVDGIFLCVKL